jgi:hypothetical protein
MWKITLIAGALLLGWATLAEARFAANPAAGQSQAQEKNRAIPEDSSSGDSLLDRNVIFYGIKATGSTSRYWEQSWNKNKKDGSGPQSYKLYNPITIPLW